MTGASSFLYTLAATLTQPIFDNGLLAGQRDYTIAQRSELLTRYRSVILASFADVQRALQGVEHAARRQQAQEQVVEGFAPRLHFG